MSDKNEALDQFVAMMVNSMSNNGLPNFMQGRVAIDDKHDHAFDFGYPKKLTFDHLYNLYERHGAAQSLVTKTVDKSWQTFPQLLTDEDSDGNSSFEKGVNRHFKKIRFWQKLKEADRRGLVGNYGAVIFRFGDDQEFDKPVKRMNGIASLVDVIPCWEGQFEVTQWENDRNSPRYGLPVMATYNQAGVDPKNGQAQTFQVHHSRFMIWSRDMTTFNEGPMTASYNALLDMLKVRGAGGEGFWRNAKQRFFLQASPDVDVDQLAESFGVQTSELNNKLSEVMAKWQKSFDQTLALQGMEAKTIPTSLPIPEHFHNVAAMEAASTWNIPTRVWFGNQTGERASTEDQAAWDRANMARRINMLIPNIDTMFDRFVEYGLLTEQEYFVGWDDLTDDTPDQRMERAERMSKINKDNEGTGDPVFTVEEIRQEAGYASEPEDELPGFDGDDEDEEQDDV